MGLSGVFLPVYGGRVCSYRWGTVLASAGHLTDAADGLVHHGAFVNASTTLRSCCKWSRANGWTTMAHVETLEVHVKHCMRWTGDCACSPLARCYHASWWAREKRGTLATKREVDSFTRATV